MSIKGLTLVIGIFVMFGCGGKEDSNQFTAEMIMGDAESEVTSKIFVTESGYRMEHQQADEQLYVIVNNESGLTNVLVPSRKQYMELPSQDPMSLMNDPFQSVKYLTAMGESKLVGTEMIDGYECDKYTISQQGQEMMSQWVSRKFNFPLKIVIHVSDGKHMEIKNIREGAVDEELFKVPAEYSQMPKPGEEPAMVPEWAEDIPSAPVMKPPFERDLSIGDMIRVPVEPGKSFKAKATGKTEADAVARAVPFKDGKPLKNISMYSNFAQKGTICTGRHETTQEADEIVIRVFDGEIALEVKQDDMLERKVSAGEELRYPLKGSDPVETRFVNLVNGQSVCTFDYYEGGEKMDEEKVGPAQYRRIMLAGEYDVKASARAVNGDEIVFNVEKGEILIKIGQFNTFEF